MAHYTRIEPITPGSTPVYEDIILSSETKNRRNQLKSLMDEFCSFTWRGNDAFEIFGAFIINSRNLKFYNGPTYSNQYTKPQFESASGALTGVSFNIQQIDFSIGVYWISEDHYRRLIYWLNPYEINTLTFGFQPNYYYQVKLAKVDNGTRSIVGYENDEPMYYTEMKLTFEVQGPNCAYHTHQYEFENDALENIGNNNTIIWNFKNKQDGPTVSDLAMPFKLYLHLDPTKLNDDILENWKDVKLNLSCYAIYDEYITTRLFEIDLQNLVFGNNTGFDIVYDSEKSLMFLNHGDSRNFLLSHFSTSSTGKRIVNNIFSQQYTIPGRFEDYTAALNKWKLKLEINLWVQGIKVETDNLRELIDINLSNIEMRARTNLI